MAATQRPVAEAAFAEPSGAARVEVPCPPGPWLPTGDKAAGADVIRSHGRTRRSHRSPRSQGSHVIMISQSRDAVADVILTAAAAVTRPTAADLPGSRGERDALVGCWLV